ncbi:unnamed protein product [Calypogeia fissa]
MADKKTRDGGDQMSVQLLQMPRLWPRTVYTGMLLLVLCLPIATVIKAAPILGPDLNTCAPIIPHGKTSEADVVSCCLPDTLIPPQRFEFPDPARQAIRIRQGVHKVNDELLTKYERGMQLMRALPDYDPRSWHAQSNLLCSYGAAYQQFNSSPPTPFDVQSNWFALPFHRLFVYFHERIIGSLIGDHSFAIPYWAWDVQNETDPLVNGILAPYSNVTSPLFDIKRAQNHLPPNPADLNFQKGGKLNPNIEEVRLGNYYMMWRTMMANTRTPRAFFGRKVALGDKTNEHEGAGVLEMGPDRGVHLWTGEEESGEDMGISYTSARDPIFFAHHSEVDRLWVLWKKLGGKDIDDPDWLDTEFIFYDQFYDQIGRMVIVTVRDSLDIDKLRYEYEDIPSDWLDFTPQSIRDITHPNFSPRYQILNPQLRRAWRSFLNSGSLPSIIGYVTRRISFLLGRQSPTIEGPIAAMPVRAPITTRVSRPTKTDSSSDIVYDEVLVFGGRITKPYDAEVRFHIFMDLPEADESTTLACVESMGSFYVDADGKRPKGQDETIVTRQFSQVIGIGPDRFRILNRQSASSLTFTFVPAWDPKHDAHVSIDFTELRVELHAAR